MRLWFFSTFCLGSLRRSFSMTQSNSNSNYERGKASSTIEDCALGVARGYKRLSYRAALLFQSAASGDLLVVPVVVGLLTIVHR